MKIQYTELVAVEHPSLRLINELDISKFDIILTLELKDYLKNLVFKFKKKFCNLHEAATRYSSEDFSRFIDDNINYGMNEFAQHVLDMLCFKSGVAVVREFPIDVEVEDIEIALFIFSCYLGVPLYSNRDKVYIWPVVPTQIASSKNIYENVRPANTGSPIGFHTDPSTIVGLLCIIPSDYGGENELVSSVSVHNKIYEERPDLLQVLYSKFYIDRRGEEMAGNTPYAEMPIFGINRAGYLMTHWTSLYTLEAYRKYDVNPLTDIQLEALNYLIKTIKSIALTQKITTKLSSGDLLFCNNNLVFHSRKEFHGDRHMLRTWIYSNKYESLPHLFGYNCR